MTLSFADGGGDYGDRAVHIKACILRLRFEDNYGSPDSIECSPQEVEGRDSGEMVHVSDTKGGREPRSYLSGYFIIQGI